MFYPLFSRFLRFVLVGGLTALIYFSLFHLLWMHFYYNYHLAITLSWIAAILFYFLANRYFTFNAVDKNMSRQFLRFLFLVLINYFITLGITHTVVETVKLSPYTGMM